MIGKNLVSIGMPVFNDKKYLKIALDSILSQSYKNFELIISDDCSTDGSDEICKIFQQADRRIRYIRQKQNIGISKNMEFLLKEADGKYFMWAGDDDVLDKDFIKSLIKPLLQNNGVISSYSPVKFIDNQGEILESIPARVTDYSARTKIQRLFKLVTIFCDSMGYGLFIREKIIGVEFPTWWWINKKNAINNIYPTLCYYLVRGNFTLVGEKPLRYSRIKTKEEVNHKFPYNNQPIKSFFAFSLCKLNLVLFSLRLICKAEKNIISAIIISPIMFFFWFLLPVFKKLLSTIKVEIRKEKII